MNSPVVSSLEHFIERFLQFHNEQQLPLLAEWQEGWPSACQQGPVNAEGMIPWLPVKQVPSMDFSATEKALGMQFHPDFKAFFTRYWSAGLPASTERGELELLQVWNADDFERLQQNLIGHVLMKRRLRQPESLFFAVTDDDDYILSVDNKSGSVMLERVGSQPKESLSETLAGFIDTLTPLVPSNEG